MIAAIGNDRPGAGHQLTNSSVAPLPEKGEKCVVFYFHIQNGSVTMDTNRYSTFLTLKPHARKRLP